MRDKKLQKLALIASELNKSLFGRYFDAKTVKYPYNVIRNLKGK